MEKNTTSSRHFRLLFQTPGRLCLLEEEENAEPQQGDEFPGDVRAPLLFFALSVGFEQTQQVCLTYTMQPSFIRMPPARHQKSPPPKKQKKKKRKKPLSCFTTQHPNRVASSLALPSSPHINLSVCTVGHPLAVLVSDSNIYRKTMLAGLTGSQHSLVVPRFFLIPGTTRDETNAGWFTRNEPCDD